MREVCAFAIVVLLKAQTAVRAFVPSVPREFISEDNAYTGKITQ
jgi:hypothetical protein